jgi:hypothetical protein
MTSSSFKLPHPTTFHTRILLSLASPLPSLDDLMYNAPAGGAIHIPCLREGTTPSGIDADPGGADWREGSNVSFSGRACAMRYCVGAGLLRGGIGGLGVVMRRVWGDGGYEEIGCCWEFGGISEKARRWFGDIGWGLFFGRCGNGECGS